MARKRRATTTCPQCAGEFPLGRLACPHCGSDEKTGWSEGTDDYSYTDEDYEETIASMQGRDDLDSPKWRRRKRLIMVTGLVIVFLFVFFLVMHGSAGW